MLISIQEWHTASMENYGKAPNTEPALEVTQLSYYTSFWEPSVFKQLFIPTKMFSGSSNSAVDKLNERNFPFISLN